MARTKADARHPIGQRHSPSKERDAGSGTEEGATNTLEDPSCHSFVVVLKDSHICFPGGSEYLEMPTGFDVAAGMRAGDFMGTGDWVKLEVVDDASFEGGALVVYNKRKRMFEMGKGIEALVDEYMLASGTRLRFSLLNAAPYEFSVKIGKSGGTTHESSDENDEQATVVAEKITATTSWKKHRRSRLKTSKLRGSGYNGVETRGRSARFQ